MAIEIYQNKYPIIMKTKLVHWVTEETWQRISDILAEQKAHGFIRIKELNITINTAEIDGAYNIKQYEDLCKINQGMWQCEFGNWHNKGKKECDCKKEYLNKKRAEEDRKIYQRPELTEEEIEQRTEAIKKNKEIMLLHGTLYKKDSFPVRRSTILELRDQGEDIDTDGVDIIEDTI